MTKKIITGVVAAILLVTLAVFAAEKVREKAFGEKCCPKAKAGEQFAQGFGRHERLLDELVEAYKANDRDKMGQIIHKMQERREKMREFVKINRWHRWAHRRMMRQMGPGWGWGRQMVGPGWNQGCPMAGPGWNPGWAMQNPCANWGCPMAGPRWQQFEAMNGCCGFHRGGMGPIASEFQQMPCQQGGMGNCMPQQCCPMQTPGWGRGFQRDWAPGPGADNMGQQEWNMPRRERQNRVPPPEWGW